MELFNLITKQSLTPNQFYLLYSIKENISALHINMHQELRYLLNEQWIENDATPILTAKAHTLLQQVQSFFHIQKKKTSNQVLGKDYEENISKYTMLFPKIKLGSGHAARVDPKNLETAFKWFFENYDYTWDIILKATALYLDEEQKNNYKHTQTSQYFIRKQNSDKTWASTLSNKCYGLSTGDFDNQSNIVFKEKIF